MIQAKKKLLPHNQIKIKIKLIRSITKLPIALYNNIHSAELIIIIIHLKTTLQSASHEAEVDDKKQEWDQKTE